MSNYCHYHPLNPAKWHCERCAAFYCAECMPEADEATKRANCPKCGSDMKYLGAVNQIEPFWNRIPAFFAYPLHPAPLSVMAICTITPLIMRSPIMEVVTSLFLLAVLIKYTYTVIEATSQGRLQAPSVAEAFSAGKFSLAFQQVVVFIIMGLIINGAERLGGPILSFLVAAFLILALPASIILLAMEEQISDAVNPLRLLGFMSSIGWPYLVLYGYLILLVLAQSVALEFVASHFTQSAIYPVSGLISSYFTLVIFHMLGYMVFQYQDRLGYSADIQENNLPATLSVSDKLQRLDADIDIALKEGKYEQAIGIISEQVAKFPTNKQRLEQLYKLLTAMHDEKTLVQYAQPLARMFVTENKSEMAATLLKRVWTQSPDYLMQDMDLIFMLCRAFYQSGEYKLVIKISKDLHHRFENNPKVADCYLLLAKTLANGLQQWSKAGNYLTFVKKSFPEHPVQAHMADLEAALATHRRLEVG